MMDKHVLNVADLFCGGGGTSTGMVNAFGKAGIPYHLIGVNHWNVAISTIHANHEGDYYCAPVDGIEPTDVVKGGVLDILWASPECTNHSRAKGGMPRQNQSRCQPEILLTWIRKLIVRRMYVENVPDFLDWGPLLPEDAVINGKTHKAGTPDPHAKGVLFRNWIESVRVSGYDVEWRLLNAADYGAPTSRTRLIIQAVRQGIGEHIAWPAPTHSKTGADGLPRWVPASKIIDWGIHGQSIFNRKRPLSANTLRRIENGIRKYWGAWAEPFIILMRGTKDYQLDCTARPVEEPLPTISAGGIHAGVVEPLLCSLRGTTDGALGRTAKPVDDTVPTIAAGGTHIGVVEPFLSTYHGGDGGERRTAGMDSPVPTVDCANRHGVVEGFVVDLSHTKSGDSGKTKPLSSPLGTVVCDHGSKGVVTPMFVPQQSAGTVKPVDGNPVPTISTTGAISVVTPLLQAYYGSNKTSKTVDGPLDTIPTKGRFSLTEGHVLTLPDGRSYKLDITFRMLQPHELARAMSFPDGYKFSGNKTEVIRQIGNAVCPKLSEALIDAALADRRAS